MLGRIYVLKSNETDKVYIGSTTKSLSERLRLHKKDYKRWLKDNYHYVSSFEIIQYSDAFIELLEQVDVEDKTELHKIEGRYIKDNMNCVNKRIAGRNKKQYLIDNIDKVKERKKRYYRDNKDKIIEQVKQYCDDNKEQLSEYGKQYYRDNKEQISEYKKRYWDDHKDKISEKRKQKVTCDCGSVVRKSEISRHRKTHKHLQYIQSLKENN